MNKKLYIRKMKPIQGFIGTTYAVLTADGKCLKICATRKEAEAFVREAIA